MGHGATYNTRQQNGIENVSKTINITVFKGLSLALLSGVFFALMSVIIKQMKNIHPGQLAVYRSLALMTFSLPEAIKCRENLLGPKNFRFLIIINAILAATSMFLNFVSFRYLPLGESAVIIQSAPMFVTVSARIFLKEPCGNFQSFTVVLTVVGILLITKIPQKLAQNSVVYTKESIYGLLASMLSLIFTIGSRLAKRHLRVVHHSIIIFNCGWIAFLETTILTVIVGHFQMHNCDLQGLYIIFIGVFSYVAYLLLIKALQCELTGPVSTIRAASDIAVAFLFQTLLFYDIPDLYTSIGALLVGVSVIFVGLEKWVSSLNEESSHKKKLGWMLK